MSLTGAVRISAERIRALVAEDDAAVRPLRDMELPRSPFAKDEILRCITALKVTRCAINAEVNSILACCAAGVSTGELRDRMLESLHRAGDRSLDDEATREVLR